MHARAAGVTCGAGCNTSAQNSVGHTPAEPTPPRLPLILYASISTSGFVTCTVRVIIRKTHTVFVVYVFCFVRRACVTGSLGKRAAYRCVRACGFCGRACKDFACPFCCDVRAHDGAGRRTGRQARICSFVARFGRPCATPSAIDIIAIRRLVAARGRPNHHRTPLLHPPQPPKGSSFRRRRARVEGKVEPNFLIDTLQRL